MLEAENETDGVHFFPLMINVLVAHFLGMMCSILSPKTITNSAPQILKDM